MSCKYFLVYLLALFSYTHPAITQVYFSEGLDIHIILFFILSVIISFKRLRTHLSVLSTKESSLSGHLHNQTLVAKLQVLAGIDSFLSSLGRRELNEAGTLGHT